MDIVNISTQWLKDLWYERSTVRALVTFLFFLNALLSSSATWLLSFLGNMESFKDPKSLFALQIAVVVSLLLANAILIILWYYWRSAPTCKPHENTILFSPHYNSECGKLVQSIFERLVYELDRRNMSDSMKAIWLSRNLKVKNSEEANLLISKTNARLIIYGMVDKGNVENEGFNGFKNISFHLRHRRLAKIEEGAVTEDLANALAYRTFTAKENNNFIDNEIVTNNLTEVTLFFISLALTLESKLTEAISILKPLYNQLAVISQRKAISPQMRSFTSSVRRCYAVALDARYNKFYKDHLIGNITDRQHDDYFRKGENLLSELLEVDPQRSEYPLRQAIFDFHFDRIDAAFSNIAKARRLAPENDPAPHFSFAFLCLWRGQYKRAVMEYNKVASCSNHNISVFGPVLDFIQNIYSKHPSRIEYLFALGFINHYFFDIEKSRQDYTQFLYLSEGVTKYSPLTEFAQSQLVLISSQNDD